MVWHGTAPTPDWEGWSRYLAWTHEPLAQPREGVNVPVYGGMNWSDQSLSVELPPLPRGKLWYRISDSSLSDDLCMVDDDAAQPVMRSPNGKFLYTVARYASVSFIAR
jgi:hypothetical protein